MHEKKYVNVVFQGGGVRGIAYAGVLESKPDHVHIHAAAGTSAGSIVAALLAIGKTSREIKDILQQEKLRNLVQKAEIERTELLRKAWHALRALETRDRKGRLKIPLLKARKFAKSHEHVLPLLKDIWMRKGLHSSTQLRDFLDSTFQDRTFESIEIEDLKIVAADVSRQKFEIYSSAQNPRKPIAEAVHASVSIPIFFEPFMVTPSYFVDGGLLSNFPSFLFAQGYYPTVGFRLIDLIPPARIDTTWDYLKALLLTMTDAHDKQRGDPPHFTSYPIPTPSSIPSTKFALTENDIRELFAAGQSIGKSVQWDEHASTTRVVNYYDPDPHATLDLSLRQAHQLFKQLRPFVDELDQETTFSVKVEADWTTCYTTTETLRVTGDKQIALTRYIASGEPMGVQKPVSLVAFKFTAREFTSMGPVDLIRIPAYNTDQDRGYLLFFTPAISSLTPRKFETSFEIQKEFARTLEKGRDDLVRYEAERRAVTHRLNLTIEILLDTSLPELRFDTYFQPGLARDGAPVYDPESRQVYHRFFVRLPQMLVTSSSSFTVAISRV